jgi:hypothetical protein
MKVAYIPLNIHVRAVFVLQLRHLGLEVEIGAARERAILF